MKSIHLKLVWLVSLIATLGSLYFSEVRHFIPCELCWYQRILMYPILLMTTIALLKEDGKLLFYTAVFSGIGMCVSLYHYLKQKLPAFNEITGECKVGIPCSAEYINWFGFVTIPFLALTAFILIFSISLHFHKKTK